MGTIGLSGKKIAKKTVLKKKTEVDVLKAPVSEVKKTVSVPNNKKQVTHEMIAKKAYELYEKRGCLQGFESIDWFEAKKILEAGE